MPAPTTADELLDFVQKSGLVDETKLRTYVQKTRDAGTFPDEANRLGQFLVRDGLLTYFQAEQLLQGKYKRFSLGKYKVLEKLGSGGMGTVFLCEHKLMRRRVAVKVLPFQKAEDKASLDRFMREARAAAAVDHPNIVRAYDIDQDENLHFLVMEWVDGTNLQDLVKKFGPLDPLRACHYIYGAAVGLQHAYEIGLLHRDIKPGNILIDRTGVVKILDLGLARLTHDTEDNLTRINDESVLGTADYLAPEQALDSHTVDTRADIYSLGATFYFLLTGSPPFPEGSVAQKLIWHQNRPPRSLKSLRNEIPDGIVQVVETMMAKDPAKRYQTPSEVMAALSGWVSTPIPPPADREMPTLSPAVAGERAVRPSAAPSMVGARGASGPVTLAGAPTTITNGSGAAPLATAVTADEPAVWSTLDGDTPTSRVDTDKPSATRADTGRSSRARRADAVRAAANPGSRRKTFLLIGAAALFAAVSAVGVYFAFFNKKEPGDGGTHQPPPPSGSRKLVVSKSGGENTYQTLRQALEKAGGGDTVVIAEAKMAAGTLTLLPKHKGLTIESGLPDGKAAVIEYDGIKGGAMLDLRSVTGVKVRNVELDGRGEADSGVQVNGTAADTTFEGVTVRGVLKTGFRLWNATGEAGHPLLIDRARVAVPADDGSGVLSLAGGNLDNRAIVVRNSRFDGAGGGGVGVRAEGPVLDLEVSGNRFHNLAAAVGFKTVGRPSKGAITNNTVFQAPAGVWFDVPAKDGTAFEFKVERNYFARTQNLARAPAPVPKLTSADNVHDGASGQGAAPLAAERRDQPALPEPKPDEPDATFLRFPGGNRPTAGPAKAPVGAP